MSDAVYAQSETSIAIDPANPQIMVAGSNDISPTPSQMDAYVSADGGSTWTRQTLPAADNVHPSGGSGWGTSDPSVAVSASGTLYYGYLVYNAAQTSSSIVVAHAVYQNGFQWSTPVVAGHGMHHGYFDDKPYIAVDQWPNSPHEGNVYAVWTQNSGSGTSATQAIMLATSSDGGLTWSTPVQVSGPQESYVLYAEPRVAPDGSVYVVWDDYFTKQYPQSVIAINRCDTFNSSGQITGCGTAAGLPYPTNINLAPQPANSNTRSGGPYTGPGACTGLGSGDCYAIPAQPNRGIAAVPSLAINSAGHLFVAWTDAPSPGAPSTYVLMSRSTDQGAEWSVPVQISNPAVAYSFFPWLTIDPTTGTLVATFYSTLAGSTNNERVNVYSTESTNGGVTWSSNQLLTTATSDEGQHETYCSTPVGATTVGQLFSPCPNPNNYGDYEGVAAYGGRAQAVWTDTRHWATMVGGAPREEDVYTQGFALSTAGSVVVTPSPSFVVGGQQTQVSVAVYDANGNLMPGATVDLTTSAGTFTSSGKTTAQVQSGQSVALTAPAASTEPVAAAISASVSGASPSVTGGTMILAVPSGTQVSSTTSGFGGAGGTQSPTPDTTITTAGTGGTGSGQVEIADFKSDPVGQPNAGGTGVFFDIAVSPGNTFSSVSIKKCDLNGGSTIDWWNGSAWVPASDQSYAPGTPACVTVTVTRSSSPSLSDLGGTVFAAGTAGTLASGDTLSFLPSPIAPIASLAGNQQVDLSVYAKGASGAPIPYAAVYLSFSGTGSAAVGTTPLAPTPAEFVTDGSGQVAITYTTPTTLGSVDTVTAASDSTSSPAVTASDSYTFIPSGGAGGAAGGAGPAGPLLPTVIGVSPDTGPTGGGTTVTIDGSEFTGATGVDFGSTAATSFTVDSPSQITAVSPSGTGTVDVTVTTSAGPSSTTFSDRFTYEVAAPVQPTPATNTPKFSDVPSSYWAAAYINELAAKGIINGFPDGTFRPNAPVSRAQFVKMLALTIGLKPGSGGVHFKDVAPSDWFAPYVSATVKAGLVYGVSPTSFAPASPLTREEMATLISRTLRYESKDHPLPAFRPGAAGAVAYRDQAGVASWAQQAVQYVSFLKIMNGFPDGTFHPLADTTRAQTAAVLVRLLGVLNGAAATGGGAQLPSAGSTSGGTTSG